MRSKRHIAFITGGLLLALALLPCLLSGQAPKYEIQFVKPDSASGFFIHNEEQQTIDLFLRGALDNYPYWTFTTDMVKFREIVRGDTLDLEVKSLIRESSPLFSSTEDVLHVSTRSRANFHDSPRTYLVEWVDGERILASDSQTQNWAEAGGLGFNLVRRFSFLDLFFLGLTVLAVLLLILSEGVPLLRRLDFERKYVKPYFEVQRNNERRLHPVTGIPLGAEEKVVAFCNREICNMPLSLWERKNFQCWHYPDQCNGVARIGVQKFFTQSHNFKQLNWLWFGALGGFLAWVIFILLQEPVASMLSGSRAITRELTSLGIGIGLGVTFALSWVEERGLAGDASWRRILFRTGLGGVISALIFYLGSLPIRSQDWGMAVLWVVFCVILGGILSFRSSIQWRRGLISGAIAGAVSALIYLIIMKTFPSAELAILLALITMGGLLGWTILQVVSQMERIELQVLSPTYRAGTIYSLDKWLHAGERITIGRDGKTCQRVRIKWEDDFVLPQHLELFMLNNKVHLLALPEAEVWVNNQNIKNGQGIALEGGERIQLGRHSTTTFKYMQKE